MIDLLAELLPLIAAAAANPAVVMIVALVLTAGERPLARAGAFVAGFGGVLAGVGVFGLVAFHGARETVGPGGSLFAWIDVGIGVAMLAMAGVSLARRGRGAPAATLIGRVPTAGFVGVGAVFMLTDTSALVAYAPILRDIAISGLGTAERAATLAIADLLIVAPVAAPLVIRVLAPSGSERALAALRRFLDRYGYLIASAVFAAIGIYLLVRGLGRL